jgi:hypothetical protein
MDKESAALPRRCGQHAYRGTVHESCKLLLFLSLIDGSIGRGIDNDIGLDLSNEAGQIAWPR